MTTQEMRTLTAVERYCNHATKPAEPDWEQRRYELAKEMVLAYITHPDPDCHVWWTRNKEAASEEIVKYADILIAELKKSSK